MSETAGGEANRTNEISHSEDSETLTTGQAAERLGLSLKEVRTLCEAGELRFFWSRAHRVSHDRNGYELRGHRKIFANSVAAYAGKLAFPYAASPRTTSGRDRMPHALRFRRAGFRTFVARTDHAAGTYRLWSDGKAWHLAYDGAELAGSPWRLKREAVASAIQHAASVERIA